MHFIIDVGRLSSIRSGTLGVLGDPRGSLGVLVGLGTLGDPRSPRGPSGTFGGPRGHPSVVEGFAKRARSLVGRCSRVTPC